MEKDKQPDIIENLEMVTPPDPFLWLWVSLAVLVLLAIGGGVFYWLYQKKKLPFQEPPPVAPDITALEALGKIRPLMEEATAREFVLEVSKILRYYIEGRFELKAPHLSTEEFLFHAEKSDKLPPEYKVELESFLQQCDRVKFALANMEQPGLVALYETAEKFIHKTKQTKEEFEAEYEAKRAAKAEKKAKENAPSAPAAKPEPQEEATA